jgi:holo-[acyl-carrier protein] synthase
MENELLQSIERLAIDKNVSIGNDLVFISDFQPSLTDLFKQKVYTVAEIAYCDQFDDDLLRYASTWAAKEAVYKAIKQLDQRPIAWKNIEILREKIGGKPEVRLHNHPLNFNIRLSISHDGQYAWAVALAFLIKHD